jgi:hypothetical protein
MNLIINHTQQHNGDISLEEVNNLHKMPSDQAIVKDLIKDVNKQYFQTANKAIKQALNQLTKLPLTREKCESLRFIIAQNCDVVPNNMLKEGNLIMITKVITVSLGELQKRTRSNQEEFYQNQALNDLKIKIFAVSQQASDALDRYIDQLIDEERQPLLPRQQPSKICCLIL